MQELETENTIVKLPPTSKQNTAGTLNVIRRDSSVVSFDPTRIAAAITKAFWDVEGSSASASSHIHEVVTKLTVEVSQALAQRYVSAHGGMVHLEEIQDQVELALMRNEYHQVARAYILYREEHRKIRESKLAKKEYSLELMVTLDDGARVPLDISAVEDLVHEACTDLTDVSADAVVKEALRNLFNGVPIKEVHQSLLMSARTFIEQEPNYSFVASRLLLRELEREALQFLNLPVPKSLADMKSQYPATLAQTIKRGIQLELLAPELMQFDFDKLGAALKPERDFQFTYLGLQTLYDRYFIHSNQIRFEIPQIFFMRIAMGLALKEAEKERRAIEFYNLISSFDYMSATPTLFNSGTPRSQLSSCFLTTVPDDLAGIYNAIKDNAMLSKFAGGLGNDWTPVRAMNAHIKATNGKSQGVVPFLKVANDTAVAVNQGGKRKGSFCAYLETWHLDIEEFLELRKNTGDERRRTHDMNTANWIPDLFMKRVIENKEWTLFSPDEVSDLHDLYGLAFEEAYARYEEKAKQGKIRNFKTLPAVNLWRKMLGMLFETGHPWITFKDPCNLRSPQSHVGVIHSSNLCTEITLNTSQEEIAVCNLGSINLVQHINDKGLDVDKLRRTIKTAIRMLDNVMDINYYAVIQARRSNLKHRPIGMGLMGFQDALYKLGIPYTSNEAVEFADRSMEIISYEAISASCDLAAERGTYETYEGSLWSKGILPIDSIARLQATRGIYLDVDLSQTLDWDTLRKRVTTVGMRNSNVMAIAPTATISNICGVTQSIEPTYQNLYVKSNLSGEFTIVNPYLVADLKKLGIWDTAMVKDLKFYNGSVQRIDRIPDKLKQIYATAFEIDAKWLIDAGSRRQKWIDQAQSLNLYMKEPSGKKLDVLYRTGWLRGLKTFYYLRTLGASDVEKSTIHDKALNAVSNAKANTVDALAALSCSIDNGEDCEACQ